MRGVAWMDITHFSTVELNRGGPVRYGKFADGHWARWIPSGYAWGAAGPLADVWMLACLYEVTQCTARRLMASEQATEFRRDQCSATLECEWLAPLGTVVDRIVQHIPSGIESPADAGAQAAVPALVTWRMWVHMGSHWMPWAVAAQPSVRPVLGPMSAVTPRHQAWILLGRKTPHQPRLG